jgi:hypothetical protein
MGPCDGFTQGFQLVFGPIMSHGEFQECGEMLCVLRCTYFSLGRTKTELNFISRETFRATRPEIHGKQCQMPLNL